MVGIVISNAFKGKNNKIIREKVQTKFTKTAISGIFPAFSAGKKFFSKIGLRHVMGIAIKNVFKWKNNEI